MALKALSKELHPSLGTFESFNGRVGVPLTGDALEAHKATGKRGGDVRAATLSNERKSEIASIAAKARWAGKKKG